jgi:thioredoxin 1
MTVPYSATQPESGQIGALPGSVVLDFGTNWCGHCQASQPVVDQALSVWDSVRHIKVEDGPGRLLGRTYGVKLWPTLVFLRDGKEVARLVRPLAGAAIRDVLATMTNRDRP